MKLCFLSKAKMWHTVYLSSALQGSIVTVNTCAEWRGPLNHPHVHRSISAALVHFSHCRKACQSSHGCLCTLPPFAKFPAVLEENMFFLFFILISGLLLKIYRTSETAWEQIQKHGQIHNAWSCSKQAPWGWDLLYCPEEVLIFFSKPNACT